MRRWGVDDRSLGVKTQSVGPVSTLNRASRLVRRTGAMSGNAVEGEMRRLRQGRFVPENPLRRMEHARACAATRLEFTTREKYFDPGLGVARLA
jgi:hypothetical protein